VSEGSVGVLLKLEREGTWAVAVTLDHALTRGAGTGGSGGAGGGVTQAAPSGSRAAACPPVRMLQLVSVDTRAPQLAWQLLSRPDEESLLLGTPGGSGPGPGSGSGAAAQQQQQQQQQGSGGRAAGMAAAADAAGVFVLQLNFSKPIKKLAPHLIGYSACSLVSLSCSGPQYCTMRVRGEPACLSAAAFQPACAASRRWSRGCRGGSGALRQAPPPLPACCCQACWASRGRCSSQARRTATRPAIRAPRPPPSTWTCGRPGGCRSWR
jgi:hypothetical protein